MTLPSRPRLSWFLGPFVACLAGCANLQGVNSAAWPWSANARPCRAAGGCDATDAMNAFEAASNYCREVQNYYESGGRRSESTRFAVGAIGTLAGTVMAPITGGGTAKAFAGISGASNAIQLSLEETFSATVAIKRRLAVASAAGAGASAVAGTTDSTERVMRSVVMAADCSMAAAAADNAALQSLAGK